MPAEETDRLTIERCDEDDRLIVVVCGELDPQTAPLLEQTLVELDLNSKATLVVDLAGIQFMDSAGLRVIVSCNERLDDATSLVLRAPSEPARRVLEITGLSQHLVIE